MSNEELIHIRGGMSATILNAIARIMNTLLELGRTLGSVMRNKKC